MSLGTSVIVVLRTITVSTEAMVANLVIVASHRIAHNATINPDNVHVNQALQERRATVVYLDSGTMVQKAANVSFCFLLSNCH